MKLFVFSIEFPVINYNYVCWMMMSILSDRSDTQEVSFTSKKRVFVEIEYISRLRWLVIKWNLKSFLGVGLNKMEQTQ